MGFRARNSLSGAPPAREGDRQLVASLELSLKRHVQGVSFPRSGHHLLVDFLQHYFACRFVYCEYYHTCHQLPCANPANNLQKNHDFDLNLPTDGAGDYLLQYRHPLYAVTSNYFLHLSGEPHRGEPFEAGKEPIRIWHEFAVRDVEWWKVWMRKWILGNDNPRVWTLAYEDLLHHPVEMLSAAAEYLCPSHTADRQRVEFLVEQLQVRAKHALTDFRHFDVAFFRDLEERARDEIEAVGLPLVMSSDSPPPLVPQRRPVAGLARAAAADPRRRRRWWRHFSRR